MKYSRRFAMGCMVLLLVGFFAVSFAQAKEPYATAEEYGKYVANKDCIPWTELVPGANSRLIWGDGIMVSFITMSPWSFFPRHAHGEQIMIVVDGYMDEMIDGKLYRVKKGDVIRLPAGTPHGGYIYDVPCSAIDIFTPVRADYIEKT
ncbi:MAG: cupin domain-containing protein, partial [candidate division NC10 bacterium]|nr:cupin domain-containing protein [candidate division NC10 bacterium]